VALSKADRIYEKGSKKRTSIGDGLRKRGSFKTKRKKPYRGQGK